MEDVDEVVEEEVVERVDDSKLPLVDEVLEVVDANDEVVQTDLVVLLFLELDDEFEDGDRAS